MNYRGKYMSDNKGQEIKNIRNTCIYKTLSNELDRLNCNNFAEHVRKYIDVGFPVDYTPSKRHSTLLYKAIRQNLLQKTKILLEAGAQISIPGKKTNGLLLAVKNPNDFRLINLLIKRTSYINLKDAEGHAALWYICNQFVAHPWNSVLKKFIIHLLDAGAVVTPDIDTLLIEATISTNSWEKEKIGELLEFLRSHAVNQLKRAETKNNCSKIAYEYEL